MYTCWVESVVHMIANKGGTEVLLSLNGALLAEQCSRMGFT